MQLANSYDSMKRRTKLAATVVTTADFQTTWQYDNLSRVSVVVSLRETLPLAEREAYMARRGRWGSG